MQLLSLYDFSFFIAKLIQQINIDEYLNLFGMTVIVGFLDNYSIGL